jgi:hypothetical protein
VFYDNIDGDILRKNSDYVNQKTRVLFRTKLAQPREYEIGVVDFEEDMGDQMKQHEIEKHGEMGRTSKGSKEGKSLQNYEETNNVQQKHGKKEEYIIPIKEKNTGLPIMTRKFFRFTNMEACEFAQKMILIKYFVSLIIFLVALLTRESVISYFGYGSFLSIFMWAYLSKYFANQPGQEIANWKAAFTCGRYFNKF